MKQKETDSKKSDKKIRKRFSQTNFGFMIISCVAALAVVVLLVLGTLFWLDSYTRHGEEYDVPDIVGMYIDEAEMIVAQQGMHVQVIDSTYSRRVPLGSIVDQSPKAESKAKEGRAIYVIVNAKSVRTVPVPNLRDVSYRQAEANLQSLGFEVGEIEYEPSVYKDLVLDIKHDGEVVEPGTRVQEGELLTLVVGFGQGTEQVKIPDLIGKTKSDARITLLRNRLILGSIDYDVERTAENDSLFVVYEQSPRAEQDILEGSRVDIKMTTSLEKAATAATHHDEEEFF